MRNIFSFLVFKYDSFKYFLTDVKEWWLGSLWLLNNNRSQKMSYRYKILMVTFTLNASVDYLSTLTTLTTIFFPFSSFFLHEENLQKLLQPSGVSDRTMWDFYSLKHDGHLFYYIRDSFTGKRKIPHNLANSNNTLIYCLTTLTWYFGLMLFS